MASTEKIPHPLKYGVVVDGVEVMSIPLGRIKAKHLRGIENKGSGTEQTFHLIQKSSGWPPEAVDEIDAEDLESIGEVLERMTGKTKGG